MLFCNRYTPSILKRIIIFSAIKDSFRFRKTTWIARSLILVSDGAEMSSYHDPQSNPKTSCH